MSDFNYKKFLDHSSDGVFVLDEHAKFLYVNQTLAAASGKDPQWFFGRDGLEFVPAAERFQVQKIFGAVLRGESFRNLEVNVPDSGEGPRWISISFVPEWDGGQVTGILGTIQDRSECKRLQQELQAAELQCRSTIDFIRDAIHVIDPDFNIRLFNTYFKEWVRDMGLSLDPVGQNLFDVFPFLNDKVRDEYKKVFRTGRLLVSEEASVVNGQEILTETRKIPVSQKGRVIQVITVIRDVSKQKKAVLLSEQKEELLQFAINQVSVPVIIAQAPDVRMTYVNQAASDLLVKEPPEVQDIRLEEQRDYWPTFYPDGTPYDVADQPLTRAIKHGESCRDVEVIIRKKQEERWVSVSASPLVDEKGQVVAGIVVFPDVTERKKSDQMIAASEERLKDLMENMSSGVAVYETSNDGLDFRIKSVNRACERVSDVRREEVVGRPVTEIFPAVKDMGLLDVFRRVWQTGQPETQAATLYKDGRISQWVENYVYRLASGEVVAIYDDVTQLCRTKEELQNIFDLSVDLICIAGLDGYFKKVNPAFTQILGYSQEEWLAVPFLDFVHPEDVPFTKDLLEQKLAKGQKAIGFENRYRHKDGGYRWLSWEGNPAEDGLLYAVARDVTEQKRFYQELADRERELRLLLQKMINAFVLFDSVFDEQGRFISYRFVYINEAYETITGVKNDDVRGKTVHDVWPDTEPSWIEAYGQVAVTGKASSFEMYHDPTGKWYYCNVYRPGDAADRFCVIFEDITERKQSEELLRESESRYRNLFETAPMAILEEDLTEVKAEIDRLGAAGGDLREYFETHPDEFMALCKGMKTLDVNEQSLKIFAAQKKEDLLGSKEIFTSETYATLAEQMVAISRGERSFKAETVVKTLAGNQREVIYSIAFPERDSKFDRVQINVVDITERKLLEKAKAGLIRDVSHGLKTPIAMAQMGVNILDKGIRTGRPEVIGKARGIIDNNLMRLQREVGRMLSIFARDIKKSEGTPREQVDLQDLVDDLLEEIMPLVSGKGLSVTCTVKPEVRTIMAVRNEIEMLLSNLIHNAVKFTDQGKVTVSVEPASDSGVRIDVADTGSGIAPNTQGQIFDRFFKGSASGEGSGLGLSICQEIVKGYQGEISVESEGLGRGTLMTVVLTRVRPHE